jgi:hypothetical protein
VNRFIRKAAVLVLLQLVAISGISVECYSAEQCKDIKIMQNGVTKSADKGTIQIRRAPFTVRYLGQSREPSITISLTPDLNRSLQTSGRKMLLASKGDYMALYPNDIILLDEFSLFDSAEGRNRFAALIGEDYPALVEKVAATTEELSLATSISKAASGFVQNQTEGGYDYLINKINGKPVQATEYKTLHLTYFGAIEGLLPLTRQEPENNLLQAVNWGSCTIVVK